MRLVPGWLAQKKVRAAQRDIAPATAQQELTRRELMEMAVRDTLRKHGIPQHWVKAETFSSLTASRTRGMHLRLVVREWRPDLLAYTVTLQRAVLVRLIRLDPLSPGWAAGISWRYEPVDDSTCPALPPSAFWSGGVRPEAAAPGTRARLLAAAAACLERGDGPEPGPDFRPTEPMLFAERPASTA